MAVNFQTMDKLYCSYTHSIIYADGEKLMYAGSCLFRNILEATDARQNSAWREHVAEKDGVILRIRALFTYPHEAQNDAAIVIRDHQPFCNVHGTKSAKGGPIRNITENRVFDNAADACKHYGINPSTMSNHLNRRKGYVSIRGMSFERVNG